MPAIAVIIANRNNARFLPQCVESALRQSLKPTEIIVADDASTDHSLEALAPYLRDNVVKLVRNRTQQGVAATRHRAICTSQSQYFTTLDADDYYINTDKLAAEAETISARPRGIAFSDVMRVNESGESRGLVSTFRSIHEGDLSFQIRHLHGFIPRDYLVRREDYFTVGGFDASLRIYEDWELKIRLSRQCTWHYSGVIGTAYRDNPLGLSKASRREHIKTMRRIFRMHCPDRRPVHRTLAFARFFMYHSLYLRRPAI